MLVTLYLESERYNDLDLNTKIKDLLEKKKTEFALKSSSSSNNEGSWSNIALA